MSKTYILLKDTLYSVFEDIVIPAGTEFHLNDGVYQDGNGNNYSQEFVEQNIQWFQEKITKPPLGITPKSIWDEKRIVEIKLAIQRYVEAGKKIPAEWVYEKNELTNAQEQSKNIAPNWYRKDDIYEWLLSIGYSSEIGEELSELWAEDLQGAFKKGWEKGCNANNKAGEPYTYYKATNSKAVPYAVKYVILEYGWIQNNVTDIDTQVIYKIKRLSDNTTFCVGDIVYAKDDNMLSRKLCIKKFTVTKDYNDIGVFFDCQNELNFMFLWQIKKVESKNPDFTTEDGVKYSYGQKKNIYCVYPDWQIDEYTEYIPKLSDGHNKFFSTREAAKNWVLYKKPSLNLDEINRIMSSNFIMDGIHGGYIDKKADNTIKDAEVLVKQKIKQ